MDQSSHQRFRSNQLPLVSSPASLSFVSCTSCWTLFSSTCLIYFLELGWTVNFLFFPPANHFAPLSPAVVLLLLMIEACNRTEPNPPSSCRWPELFAHKLLHFTLIKERHGHTNAQFPRNTWSRSNWCLFKTSNWMYWCLYCFFFIFFKLLPLPPFSAN